MLVKTTELSQGERLLVYRRREGLTQEGMADQLGVSLYAYRKMEEESAPCSFNPPLGSLSQREQCFVQRLRHGWSLAHAAESIGISRWWLRRMERGDAPVRRLWAFWNG
jgi:DNA-binding XRE family transcriptional regulator